MPELLLRNLCLWTSPDTRGRPQIHVYSLEKKNKKYEHRLNLIAIIFTMLERLCHKLYETEKDSKISPEVLKKLKKEISVKTKQLERMRQETKKKGIYPTEEQVAHLLGISEAKQKNIGVWFHRARKILTRQKL